MNTQERTHVPYFSHEGDKQDLVQNNISLIKVWFAGWGSVVLFCFFFGWVGFLSRFFVFFFFFYFPKGVTISCGLSHPLHL